MNKEDESFPIVMILAEDKDLCCELARLAEATGYCASRARTTIGAVEVALHKRPSLLLIDLDSPMYHDLLTAAQHLREDAQLGDVPVVFLSLDGTTGLYHLPLSIGHNDYILELSSTSQLRGLLDRFLPVMTEHETGPLHHAS